MWRVLEQLDPYGQLREDSQFALLCAVVANALGGKRTDGRPWRPSDFLLTFQREAETQSDAYIEQAFSLWVTAANLRFREGAN